MNKRIRKKKIKLMIHERNISMMKVYPPLVQFLDFQSTKELFMSWDKPPTHINIKRCWRCRINRDNNLYTYTKSTYNFLKEEKSRIKMNEREFRKWLNEEITMDYRIQSYNDYGAHGQLKPLVLVEGEIK